jgi:hypothetical protein
MKHSGSELYYHLAYYTCTACPALRSSTRDTGKINGPVRGQQTASTWYYTMRRCPIPLVNMVYTSLVSLLAICTFGRVRIEIDRLEGGVEGEAHLCQ